MKIFPKNIKPFLILRHYIYEGGNKQQVEAGSTYSLLISKIKYNKISLYINRRFPLLALTRSTSVDIDFVG